MDPDTSCSDCMDNVNKMLKKLGSPIMTNLYYGTVKSLLERVSSVMVDKEAIAHLLAYVKEAIQQGMEHDFFPDTISNQINFISTVKS